jgi:hypothetical protein
MPHMIGAITPQHQPITDECHDYGAPMTKASDGSHVPKGSRKSRTLGRIGHARNHQTVTEEQAGREIMRKDIISLR